MSDFLIRSRLTKKDLRTSLSGLSREITGGTGLRGEEINEGGSSAGGGLLGESKACRGTAREVLEVRILLFERLYKEKFISAEAGKVCFD
jgi:hypothetical protein